MFPTISGNNRLAYNYSLWQSNIWRKDLGKPEAPAVKLIWSTLGEGNPRYSPDGKRIAFDSWRGGPLEIWISDADGENVVRIAKLEGKGMRDEAVAGMPMVATADQWTVTRAGIYFAPYKNPSRLPILRFCDKERARRVRARERPSRRVFAIAGRAIPFVFPDE